MDEFIREVDEEYRRERIAAIWKRYSALIVGAAVILVAAVGGWRYWEYAQQIKAEAASSQYEDAVRLSREGKAEDSERALRSLSQDGPTGYTLLARLRLAAEEGRRNPAAGATAYDAIANDASLDGTQRDLARLRASMLRLDTDAPAADRELERLATPANPWRHTAREMLGLSALKRADAEAASKWFEQIAADRDTPQGLRSRLEIYTALAAGGPVQITQ